MCSALSLHVQDVFEVLDLSLKLQHQGIVRCRDLVRGDFLQDLLRSVSELQSRYGLFRMIH